MLHHNRRPERTQTSGQDRSTKREEKKDERIDKAVERDHRYGEDR